MLWNLFTNTSFNFFRTDCWLFSHRPYETFNSYLKIDRCRKKIRCLLNGGTAVILRLEEGHRRGWDSVLIVIYYVDFMLLFNMNQSYDYPESQSDLLCGPLCCSLIWTNLVIIQSPQTQLSFACLKSDVHHTASSQKTFSQDWGSWPDAKKMAKVSGLTIYGIRGVE